MCIGIDRIDIGVYSHYTWAEAVRDSEEGVSESTTDPAPTTPPLPPPRHAEEMVRVSGQELDNIIRCLNYNVDIGMHSFSLSKAATMCSDSMLCRCVQWQRWHRFIVSAH